MAPLLATSWHQNSCNLQKAQENQSIGRTHNQQLHTAKGLKLIIALSCEYLILDDPLRILKGISKPYLSKLIYLGLTIKQEIVLW